MFATVLTIRDVKFHRVGAFLGNLEQPADSRKDVLFVDLEKNVANPESDAKNILHSDKHLAPCDNTRLSLCA